MDLFGLARVPDRRSLPVRSEDVESCRFRNTLTTDYPDTSRTCPRRVRKAPGPEYRALDGWCGGRGTTGVPWPQGRLGTPLVGAADPAANRQGKQSRSDSGYQNSALRALRLSPGLAVADRARPKLTRSALRERYEALLAGEPGVRCVRVRDDAVA
jgi:hypothetical protein